MNNRTKAAVIGGVLAGVLSALPLINMCCFLWALAGGVLAVFMYQKGAGGPMTPGDGAKLGAMAGAIGAGIYLVLALLSMFVFGGGTAAMSEAIRQQGGEGVIGAGAIAGLGAFFIVVVAAIIVGLAALGGMIGASIFGKGAGAPPPPPPAGGFGGGPAGGPAGGSFGQGS
jgi:hypothetical protein